MSSKPVSQIGRISNAPPRSRTVGTTNTLQSDTEGVKPRSLLPQPGQHRYNTRSSILPEPPEPEVEDQSPSSSDAPTPPNVATTAVQQSQTPGTASGKLRLRSMYQHGTPSSQLASQGDKGSLRSMRPPTSVVTKPAEGSKIGLGRSQSLRKPGTTSQISQPSGIGGHARTQSTSTISTTRREIAKPATASERPKSLLAAPSRSSKASNTASADKLPKPSARTTGLARPTSIRAKSDLPTAAAASAVASKPEPSSTTQARRKEPAMEEPKKASRPAFTTLQQHFTPRKTGKAPTSTFINPTPPPASNSLPPEVANLQSELLQLHLLHQSSAEISQSWEQSAKHTLHTKFDEVASLHQVMLENERAGQEQKNLQSLLEWSAGGSTAGLVENVQILSEPLHELPSLVEQGGRLQRLVAEFEQWMSWVQEIRSARQGNAETDKALGTVEGLGDSWKAEAAALTRKLTTFARGLEKLAPPTSGSSIASMTDACTSILRGILDELQTMQKIEVEVVTREKLWIEDRLRTIARDVETHGLDAGGDTASWRD